PMGRSSSTSPGGPTRGGRAGYGGRDLGSLLAARRGAETGAHQTTRRSQRPPRGETMTRQSRRSQLHLGLRRAGHNLPAPQAGRFIPAPVAGNRIPAPVAGAKFPVPVAGN